METIFETLDQKLYEKICNKVWKDEKKNGLRLVGVLKDKIYDEFKNHFQKNNLEVNYNNSSYDKDLNDKLDYLNIFMIDYFIAKLLKKSEQGISGIQKKKDLDVGFALIFNSDQEFNDAYLNKKTEVKNEVISLDLIEDLPNDVNSEKFIKNLLDQKNSTAKFITLLLKAITVDNYNKFLLKKYIEAYSLNKAKIFREEDPKICEFYDKNKAFLNLKKLKEEEKFIEKIYENNGFFTWKYEDFLINFITLVKFFTGLKVTLKIEPNFKVFLKFYCSEIVLKGLAWYFEYDLQLKNYGHNYNQLYNQLRNKQEIELDSQSTKSKLIDGTLQFHELNQENQINFPPYNKYEISKNKKFRRYTSDDLYYEIPNDPDLSISQFVSIVETQDIEQNSIFRNIDKIRLIYRAFDDVISQKSLKKEYLDSIIFLRNYNCNKDALDTKKLVFEKLNFFNQIKQLELIQIIRNFYGERISYYFLFLNHFTLWLTFPCIISIGVFIINFFHHLSKKGQDDSLSIMEITKVIYAVIIIIWASLFLKTWRQKEKLYAYFWGTETYALEEPLDDHFEPQYESLFLFNFKRLYQSRVKKLLKIFVSYCVVAIFSSIAIGSLLLLFEWKQHTIDNNKDLKISSNHVPTIIGILNGVQIKILSIIYFYVANKLTIWENHEKGSKFDYNLSIKIVIFEFINNYFSLYYIAFVKSFHQKCENNNCHLELEFQIYVVMITNFVFNIVELGLPYLKFTLNKKSYIKNYPEGNEIDFTPHGMHHQRVSEDFSTLREDYNEIVIQFGYLTFFSVAAPILPLICFILILIEKLVDTYKIFNLHKVTIIDQAYGIGLFNTVFKIWCFIGMTTNIGLVLFTNSNLEGVELYKKLIIFFVVENCILFLNYIINWNILPLWFESKNTILTLYHKNYFTKERQGLPHHRLIEKLSLSLNNDLDKRNSAMSSYLQTRFSIKSVY